MKTLRGKLTYANVVSTLCLFLLLGGGAAYAATEVLPKNSVGTKQLKTEAVTPKKLSKAAKASLAGQAGPKGDTGAAGAQGPRGPEGAAGIAAGYAYVEGNGSVDATHSLNVTSANVGHPAAGVYCFSGLSFAIGSAVANPVNVPSPFGARVLPNSNPGVTATPCPAGQTRVEIFNTTNNVQTDSAFIVWFEK
ncbi:MAG TPA: hypothetical protein VHU86_11440 [Solirubrobacterales bacterium]|jgi:hypothetical protein|nr:hypothetical protein [Solirubrobacterales bacterium]